jgi:DNA-binding MarR family transcriptional regulator
MIDRLVANGWVERRTQHDDRRVKRVYLTREAERVHQRIWGVAEATVDAALADLSTPESKQLMALLQRIKKTLVSAGDLSPSVAVIADRKPALRATRRLNGRSAP